MPVDRILCLQRYVERLLDEQRAYFEAKITSIDKTTGNTTEALNRRLEGMNEFRSALKDANALNLPRNEYLAQKNEQDKDMERFRDQINSMISRDEHREVHKKLDGDIETLRDYKNQLQGKASQTQLLWAALLGAAGFLFSLIDIVVRFTK